MPWIHDGLIQRKLATPLEYLERLALQNAVFADDFQIEGVMVSEKPSLILFEEAGQPSFVISQQWITAADLNRPTPSIGEISEYLTNIGFEPAPRSYYGWLRRADAVLIVDAKPDNFMKTQAGVTPVDLQMSSVPPYELPPRAREESPTIHLPS